MAETKEQASKIKGHRVSHRVLDDERLGTAKSGIAVDAIGDEEQKLVVVDAEDGSPPVAYDSRELRDLGPAKYTRGPVLLHPRHLLALLKRPISIFAIFSAVFFGLLLNLGAQQWDWSEKTTLLISVPVLVIALVLFRIFEKAMSAKNNRA